MDRWPSYVEVPNGPGRVAMLAYPKNDQELRELSLWGARGLLTLVGRQELVRLGLSGLESRLDALGLWWRHLPIRDLGVPGADFEARWCEISPWLHQQLTQGSSFAVHCWAGLGRTGLVVARVLVERGLSPEAAMAVVRSARPGAIETSQQCDYLRGIGAGSNNNGA